MQVVAATEVTDDYLDSTDHIAYQHSNLIQPHVLFLNVDRETRLILNASTNVDQWTALSADEVIGDELTDNLFDGITGVLDAMEQRVANATNIFNHRVTDRAGTPLVCRVFPTSTRWLVELEPEEHDCDIHTGIEQLERILLDGIRRLDSDASELELVNSFTCKLREVLGYERGMCYRFDQEMNGEVIAESVASESVRKYLGLRFPARDIPRTAREMLSASSIRTTLDQELECHQISPPLDPITQEYIDLTHVRSRGAAGSCREFYLNMNIRSTLVLPLLVENRLWGMLAFHDREVRRVSPKFDEYLQSIAKCLSISLERNLRALQEQSRSKGSQVVAELSEVDSTSEQWLNYIQSRAEDLKDLVPCDGFIFRISGRVFATGGFPDTFDKQCFANKVWELAGGRTLNTKCLRKLREDMSEYSNVAAGVIAVPLSDIRDDMVIWVRSEQQQTVRWAGDPMAKIAIDSDGRKRLCVRESFEVWTRLTEKKCLQWSESELCLATSAAMQLGLLTLSWHATPSESCENAVLVLHES